VSITVYLNGSDRTPYIAPLLSPFGFSRPLGARGTATFAMLLKSAAYVPANEPVVGQRVEIFDTNRRFFGSLDDVKKYRLGNNGGFRYDCSAVSLEQRLDKRLVTGTFGPSTPGNIAGDLLFFLRQPAAWDEGIAIGDLSPLLGPQVTITFNQTRASDALNQLAALGNMTWYVDDASGLFYFIPRETFNAPWDFTEDDGWRASQDDQIIVERNRTDLRNRQSIRFAFAALPPEREVFAGNGVTNLFPLTKLLSSVVALYLTTSVQGSVTGTFSGGIPNPGDTISVTSGTDTVTYTWRSQLNNLNVREILIGATAADCAANFCSAVNNDWLNVDPSIAAAARQVYSWPTPTNGYCRAVNNGGGSITLYARDPGAAGNSIGVASSCAHFAWGAGTLSGGTDGTTTQLSVGILNVDTGKDWYTGFGNSIYNPLPAHYPATGEYLLVQYYPIGGDVVTVEDTPNVTARAAVEGGSGIYENLVDDSQNINWNSAYLEAVGYQAAYGALLEQLTVQTDRDGIVPGMSQLFNLPSLGIVNQRYLIQQVDGVYMGGAAGVGMPHFRYTLLAINTTRLGTWLQFWAQLANGGSGSSGGSAGFAGLGTVVTPAGLITEVFYDAPIVGNHVAIELNNGRKQKIVLNQATQVTIDNPTRGGSAPTPGDWMSIYIIQDSTGGRPTPAWGSAFGSDVKNQVLDPTANTRSSYQISLHDDGLWHLDSPITTGLPIT
jgi:hypothetical protein